MKLKNLNFKLFFSNSTKKISSLFNTRKICDACTIMKNYLLFFRKYSRVDLSDSNRTFYKYAIPFFVVMIFLVLVPLIILVLYAVITKNNTETIFSFTLVNLFNFFSQSSFLKVFGVTILLALMTTIFCLVIGFPFAYVLAFSMRKRNAILILITMPIWMNTLLKTLSIKVVLQLINPNLIGTTFSMVFAMVFLFLPFMILSIYNILSNIDRNLLEASSDLGASRLQTIFRIVTPLSVPGIVNGIILVFLPALTTLVVPQYLGNGKVTIAKIIENYFINGANLPMGAAISLVLGVFSLFIAYTSRAFANKFSFNNRGKKIRVKVS